MKNQVILYRPEERNDIRLEEDKNSLRLSLFFQTFLAKCFTFSDN